MLDTCAKYKVLGSIMHTQHRGHATELASDASQKGIDYVVAVGGDGTINEVAKGLLNTSTTMGIIPRGSGNGLARHLGIDHTGEAAISQLFSSKAKKIDTLLVNNALSLNVSGIGFDGHVANLFGDRKLRGLLGYVLITLKEYFKFPEFEIEGTVENKTFKHHAFIIALANSSQYGNDIRIAPGASVSDGLVDISIIKKVPLTNVRFLISFLRGSLKSSPSCEMFTTSAITLKSVIPLPYHIDGEPCGLTDTFEIRVLPNSLSVLIPE